MNPLEKRLLHIEARLSRLEKSNRKIISEPSRPKFGSKHIGSKTLQIVIQEGFSLLNSYNPKTMTHNELTDWEEAFSLWKYETQRFSSKKIKQINNEITRMLNPQ